MNLSSARRTPPWIFGSALVGPFLAVSVCLRIVPCASAVTTSASSAATRVQNAAPQVEATTQVEAPKSAAFELPDGRAGRALAKLEATTKAKTPPKDLGAPGLVPSVAPHAWTAAATWETWSAALRAEAASAAVDPERRARLALLALEQRRTDDAWVHFAAAANADPEWAAALLPRFLPGVPATSAAGLGGHAGALPDGVVLSPSLPPPTENLGEGRFDRRAMSVGEIKIGGAVVSMRVAVESEGVQIDVKHVSGTSATFSIQIPEPREIGFGNEYVDWYRQDDLHVPHVLEVKPGEAEHTLYGRFEGRNTSYSTRIPRELPGQLAKGKLWLVAPPNDPDRALLDAIARCLSQKALGFECRVVESGAPAPDWSGIRFDLSDTSERERKLAWLAASVETFLLGDRR